MVNTGGEETEEVEGMEEILATTDLLIISISSGKRVGGWVVVSSVQQLQDQDLEVDRTSTLLIYH